MKHISLKDMKELHFNFEDASIFSFSVSMYEKLLTIVSEASWKGEKENEWILGKGELHIKEWKKIVCRFGKEHLDRIPEQTLPFGIIEPLQEIYQFDFLDSKLHIGGFSCDNSGKWIDYDIIDFGEISGNFEVMEKIIYPN